MFKYVCVSINFLVYQYLIITQIKLCISMMENKNEFVGHSDNICKIVNLPSLCKKRFHLSIDSCVEGI